MSVLCQSGSNESAYSRGNNAPRSVLLNLVFTTKRAVCPALEGFRRLMVAGGGFAFQTDCTQPEQSPRPPNSGQRPNTTGAPDVRWGTDATAGRTVRGGAVFESVRERSDPLRERRARCRRVGRSPGPPLDPADRRRPGAVFAGEPPRPRAASRDGFRTAPAGSGGPRSGTLRKIAGPPIPVTTPIDTSRMSAGKRAAFELAEAARETGWRYPTFAGGLFLGQLTAGIVRPYPETGIEPEGKPS